MFEIKAWIPMTAGAAGGNISSSWKPGGGVDDATSNDPAAEYVVGSLVDIGVSAGVGGFSNCPNGDASSVNVGVYKYFGVQINFKDGNLDGVTVGLGAGISSPVSYTMPLKNFLGSYSGAGASK